MTFSITLHLRSPRDRHRIDEHDRVSAIHKITRHFDGFTITDGKGFYDGCFEDVLLIHLATGETEAVIELARDLRRTFHHESIGIECAGRFQEATEETCADDLCFDSPINNAPPPAAVSPGSLP